MGKTGLATALAVILLSGPAAADDFKRFKTWCWSTDEDTVLRVQACDQVLASRRIGGERWLAHFKRGEAHLRLGEYDKAIADFTETIVRQPKFAPAYNRRGLAQAGKQAWTKAIADYEEAIRRKFNYDAPFNNLAWLYATAGDPAVRDPQKALDYAKRALFITDSPRIRDTLAATYAANGEFSSAILQQQLAMDMLWARGQLDPTQDYSAQLQGYQERLELYRDNKAIWQENTAQHLALGE